MSSTSKKSTRSRKRRGRGGASLAKRLQDSAVNRLNDEMMFCHTLAFMMGTALPVNATRATAVDALLSAIAVLTESSDPEIPDTYPSLLLLYLRSTGIKAKEAAATAQAVIAAAPADGKGMMALGSKGYIPTPAQIISSRGELAGLNPKESLSANAKQFAAGVASEGLKVALPLFKDLVTDLFRRDS